MATLPYPFPAMSIVNLSAYRFISLDDLPALRERILDRCEALALKGEAALSLAELRQAHEGWLPGYMGG